MGKAVERLPGIRMRNEQTVKPSDKALEIFTVVPWGYQ